MGDPNLHVEKIMQGAAPKEEVNKPHIATWFSKIKNIKSNWIKRAIFGSILASCFPLVIYLGPLMIMISAHFVQILCFSEVITIGYNYNKVPKEGLPCFRSLCWYFLIAANYFFFGETIAVHLEEFKWSYFRTAMAYHRFISFCAYLIGLVLFVLSLRRKHDLKQFRILAWTHTLLIIVVLQSYMFIDNIFQGLIWALLPLALVVLNDIFAYICGRTLGKTPLIKLSPNKTWEGFIGGFIGTFVSGFALASIMCKFPHCVCPVKYEEVNGRIQLNTSCTPSYLFQPQPYEVLPGLWINTYPFNLHFLAIALFASIIAPFGGFCASGFKRAFNIKDFSDVIPGHGGIMDRFDCQFLMATFVNVYIFTFVRNPSVDLIFKKVLYLDEDSQLQFYGMLKDLLQISDALPNSNVTTNFG